MVSGMDAYWAADEFNAYWTHRVKFSLMIIMPLRLFIEHTILMSSFSFGQPSFLGFTRLLEIFQPFRNERDSLLMDLLNVEGLVCRVRQSIFIPVVDSF